MTDFIGWDIGGAHTKAVHLNVLGVVLNAHQVPCALWRGLGELEVAVAEVLRQFALVDHQVHHVVTMTGELVDLFPNRRHGVEAIARLLRGLLGENVRFYAASHGFVSYTQVAQYSSWIASTNWHASASVIAQRVPDAILVDMGSTTTDIIPIRHGKVAMVGFSDAERMRDDTLVYTGVVRTPIMALATKLSFEGREVNVAAEYFATMADVYRLTGELDSAYDHADTADGKGKTLEDSARRLARMIGYDVEDRPLADWQLFALECKRVQQQQLKAALQKHLEVAKLVVAVGAGAFLIESLAQSMGLAYQRLEALMENTQDTRISVCFPAYAVARLALEEGGLS